MFASNELTKYECSYDVVTLRESSTRKLIITLTSPGRGKGTQSQAELTVPGSVYKEYVQNET